MKQLHFVFVFMLLLFAGITTVFAQKRTVSGKISEANGKPMPFVNVTVKGTNVGTTSNTDGIFSIDVPEGSNTLVFSIIGSKTQEINLSGRSSFNITMSDDIGELENVVVTALGIERKTKSLQFSATTVSGENLTQAREISVVKCVGRKSCRRKRIKNCNRSRRIYTSGNPRCKDLGIQP